MNKGQTLVEAVVVIAVVVLLVTGLIAGTTISLKSVRRNQVQAQATTFAEQGIEILRSLRDADWSTFAGYSNVNSYCLGVSSQLTGPTNSCPADLVTSATTYTRTAQLTLVAQTMQVTVSVAASDGSLTKPVTISTYFTEWK